jgi:periplasmic nitrate reductase NapE
MKSSEDPAPAIRSMGLSQRRLELAMFLFLAVFLWPLIAVALISGYGFAVWISDLLFGPPPLI